MIERKFDVKELQKLLERIIRGHCFKKNEERWKYIFKKVIKKLKQSYYLRFKDHKKTISEVDFLQYYFGQCAENEGFPLDYYQDPLIQKYRKRKSKKIEPDRPKSINIKFLSLVFKSDHFVKDYFEYINKDLFVDCMMETPDKFELIFKNYIKNNFSTATDYFNKNKRCKLPWSFYDVTLAIKAMRNVYEDIESGFMDK